MDITSVFFLLLLIFMTFISVCSYYFHRRFGYWKRKGIVFVPPVIPFGNVKNVVLQKSTLSECLQKIYNECNDKGLSYCGFYFFTKPILMIQNPDLIRLITTTDFQHFTDHGTFTNGEKDLLGEFLFCLKGLKWKFLRTKLTPAFTPGKLKIMFDMFVKCTDELLVIVDNASTQIDIKGVADRFIADVMASCAFGFQCSDTSKSEFHEYAKKIYESSIVQGLITILGACIPEVLDFFKLTMVPSNVRKFFINVVQNTAHYREVNNINMPDLMQLLIDLKTIKRLNNDDFTDAEPHEKFDKALTISELAAQVWGFLAAGFETSSSTLSFCLFELVQNPQVQNKLRQEIKEVIQKHHGKITFESLMEMNYLDMCVNETLRKYPPVPFLLRECTKEYTILDTQCRIEKGTCIFIPVVAIHHDPKFYPEPDNFDPERFAPENKAKRHLYSWLPFGEGPRACIGVRFALLQIKVALVTLLQNYNFTLNSRTKLPLEMDPKSITASPKNAILFTANKIH